MKILVHGLGKLATTLGKDVTRYAKGLLPKQKCILPCKWVASKTGNVWYIKIGGDDDWHGSMLGRVQEICGASNEYVICGLITLRDGVLSITCERNFGDLSKMIDAITNSVRLAKTGFGEEVYEYDC